MAHSKTLSSLFLTITVVLVIGLFQGAESRERKKGDSSIKDFGTTIMKCVQDIAGQVGKAFEESQFDFQSMLKSIMKGPCKELVSGILGKMNIKLGDFVKMGEMFNSQKNKP